MEHNGSENSDSEIDICICGAFFVKKGAGIFILLIFYLKKYTQFLAFSYKTDVQA